MKDTFVKYLRKYYPFEGILGERREAKPGMGFNRFQLSKRQQISLFLLRMSPWMCLAGFSLIFVISVMPVQAVEVFYSEYRLLLDPLLIVCVSGLIGFGTNYIAIQMLFRPVVRRPIWGQGLIPAQRDRIIQTLAKGMHKHVLSQDLIRQRVEESGLVKKLNNIVLDGTIGLLRDEELKEYIKQAIYEGIETYASREEVRKDIKGIIDSRIEEHIEGGVKKFLLKTYKKFNKEDYEQAIDQVVNNIPKVSLEVIDKLEGELNRLAALIRKNKSASEEYVMKLFINVLDRVDITGLLAKQMEHFDEAKLEKMVREATNEQLLYIQYLGTLLGILGGLLIWNTQLMAIVYLVLLGLLIFLDKFLFRLKSKKI